MELAFYGLNLIGAGFLVVVVWIAGHYISNIAAMDVEEMTTIGIKYGKKKARMFLRDKTDDVEFENKVVDEAVQYILHNAPRNLKKAGITEDGLRAVVENKLAKEKEIT